MLRTSFFTINLPGNFATWNILVSLRGINLLNMLLSNSLVMNNEHRLSTFCTLRFSRLITVWSCIAWMKKHWVCFMLHKALHYSFCASSHLERVHMLPQQILFVNQRTACAIALSPLDVLIEVELLKEVDMTLAFVCTAWRYCKSMPPLSIECSF